MAQQTISIIAAIGKNRELGKNGQLLWHIKNDMQRFKKLTTNHPVIMGRKTYESIGKSLPNRTNIIVTGNPAYEVADAICVSSFESALAEAQKQDGEIFIIGGGEMYKQGLQIADKLYLTIIEESKEADTFFPDYKEFSKILFKEEHCEETPAYTFWEFSRP